MFSTPSCSDLLRAATSAMEAGHVARLAAVRSEIARDEANETARVAALKANARRNSRLAVVKIFRATLARFEREVPSTDASDDVLRLANAADAEIRAGGAPEGLAAIIGEMAAMLG